MLGAVFPAAVTGDTRQREPNLVAQRHTSRPGPNGTPAPNG
jgi:hypothetical protein